MVGLEAAQTLALELYACPHLTMQSRLLLDLLTPQELSQLGKYFYVPRGLRHDKLSKQIPELREQLLVEPLLLFAGLNLRHLVEPLLPRSRVAQIVMALQAAVRLGHQEMVRLLLSHAGDISSSDALGTAAAWNQSAMIPLLMAAGDTDLDWALLRAAQGGHLEMVQHLVELGAQFSGKGLEDAVKGNNLEVLGLFLDRGCSDFEEALEVAALHNKPAMVELLLARAAPGVITAKVIKRIARQTTCPGILRIALDKGASNHDAIMDSLIFKGGLEGVKMMLERPGLGLNYQALARTAAYARRPDILALMLERTGHADLNQIFKAACSHRRFGVRTRRVLGMLLEAGNLDLNLGLKAAAKEANYRLVMYLLEQGATDYNRALVASMSNRAGLQLVPLLLDRGATDYNGALWRTITHGDNDQLQLLAILRQRGLLSADYSELEPKLIQWLRKRGQL